tara:strand:- start:838 stop:1089 length:252 start_codon:yes stop_codon:yes gene_type:complete
MRYSQEFVDNLFSQIEDLKSDLRKKDLENIEDIVSINWGLGITIEESLFKLRRTHLLEYFKTSPEVQFRNFPLGHQLNNILND